MARRLGLDADGSLPRVTFPRWVELQGRLYIAVNNGRACRLVHSVEVWDVVGWLLKGKVGTERYGSLPRRNVMTVH